MDSGGGYRCPWLFLLVGCVCSGWQSMCAIVSAIRQLPPNRGERWAKLQPCFLSARQIPWSVNRNARESFMSEFKVTIESPDDFSATQCGDELGYLISSAIDMVSGEFMRSDLILLEAIRCHYKPEHYRNSHNPLERALTASCERLLKAADEFVKAIETRVRKQAEVLMKELDEEGKRNAGSDS